MIFRYAVILFPVCVNRIDRLADGLLRLGDRLVDNPIIELSASLYFAYIQRVMSKLEDMADFSRTYNYFETTIHCPPLHTHPFVV